MLKEVFKRNWQMFLNVMDHVVKQWIVFVFSNQGSGKTYTIGGGSLLTQTEDELGVIPRAVKQIYDAIQVPETDIYENEDKDNNL